MTIPQIPKMGVSLLEAGARQINFNRLKILFTTLLTAFVFNCILPVPCMAEEPILLYYASPDTWIIYEIRKTRVVNHPNTVIEPRTRKLERSVLQVRRKTKDRGVAIYGLLANDTDIAVQIINNPPHKPPETASPGYLLSEKGHILTTRFGPRLSVQFLPLLGVFPLLPDSPVWIGDTWSEQMVMDAGVRVMLLDIHLEHKLEKIIEKNGETIAVISYLYQGTFDSERKPDMKKFLSYVTKRVQIKFSLRGEAEIGIYSGILRKKRETAIIDSRVSEFQEPFFNSDYTYTSRSEMEVEQR